MGQLADLYTTENMHKILSNWYGPGANNWTISDDLILYVAKMIAESESCTTFVNITPRPSGPVGAARSLTTIAIQEVKGVIRNAANNEHAIACLKSTARQMKFEVYMLKDGQ